MFQYDAVTEPEGFPAAVLLRAIQPQEGQETISARRQGRDCIGPAKLTQALAIDGALNGVDLCDPHSGLWIEAGPPLPESAILTGPRIGLTKGVEASWRYGLAGSPYLSRRF